MCQNAHFCCLQGIKMSRSSKEEQKTNVWSAKKKLQQLENKFLLKLKFKKGNIFKNLLELHLWMKTLKNVGFLVIKETMHGKNWKTTV